MAPLEPEDPAGRAGEGRRDGEGQEERTRLAWRRTTLAFALALVLAGRGVVMADSGALVGALAVAGAALVWAGFLVLTQRRMVSLARSGDRRVGPGTVLLAAGSVLALAVLAGVWLVTAPR
ncbi:hypothetical protein FH609_024220 [Streptomyces sp. 3MP-14]|uniref:DUF202 domain-containing protein n=1 Tax=Streptomyces mimosae TaxID=2586635 RepID=A0A5N6A1Z1_9ACTN|nr:MULTISPECIES: DUF202 domain-containing protein [Streptomyces]KAB8162262.1 hypothetical protein FH607_022515 [Streptomyces mimosae]KAB8173839.1 hypothetical protein FH609_024220 [Streptomyces sp. 3MP-14]